MAGSTVAPGGGYSTTVWAQTATVTTATATTATPQPRPQQRGQKLIVNIARGAHSSGGPINVFVDNKFVGMFDLRMLNEKLFIYTFDDSFIS